ncbi:hypothetical protein MRX96_002871 [Rhipicephalus microplus]
MFLCSFSVKREATLNIFELSVSPTTELTAVAYKTEAPEDPTRLPRARKPGIAAEEEEEAKASRRRERPLVHGPTSPGPAAGSESPSACASGGRCAHLDCLLCMVTVSIGSGREGGVALSRSTKQEHPRATCGPVVSDVGKTECRKLFGSAKPAATAPRLDVWMERIHSGLTLGGDADLQGSEWCSA